MAAAPVFLHSVVLLQPVVLLKTVLLRRDVHVCTCCSVVRQAPIVTRFKKETHHHLATIGLYRHFKSDIKHWPVNPTSPLGAGGLTISFFPLPKTLLPLRGGVCPYPCPLPWAWTGGAAGRWSVQDGPRWLQEGLREPKMISKMAQDRVGPLK